jgi:bile acid:Na+ symporter, BASS family
MKAAAAGLAWIGRWASPLFFIGVFTGVVLPPVASLLQPLLLPAILLPFVIALLKLDVAVLLRHARRPLLPCGLVAWSLLGAPLLVALAIQPLRLDPEIAALVVTTAACAPLMASGALAMLLGLDVALALLVVVPATALVPFTVPPMALWLAGLTIDLPAGELALRLALLVLGSAAAAFVLRRGLGQERLRRSAPVLDGLAVLGFVVFAVAVMDGFTLTALARPGFVLGILAAVFALNIALQAVTALALLPFVTRRTALTAGLVAGNNNLGLVLASVLDTAPSTMLVFVAALQFPIYLLPIIQRRLYPGLIDAEKSA